MKLEDELKMTGFPTPQDKALLNVIFTGNWLLEDINALLKPFGLTEPQYNVLRILKGQKGKPANLVDISDRMVHRSSNATRIVDKLEAKGLVTRVTCPENRRKVEISITAAGSALLETATAFMAESRKDLFEKLDPSEAELLSKLLEKLRD